MAMMKYSRLDNKEEGYLAHTPEGPRASIGITSGLRALWLMMLSVMEGYMWRGHLRQEAKD